MKLLLSCLLLALAVGIENAPGNDASRSCSSDATAERALRALTNPTVGGGPLEQYQLPKYDRKNLARLFEKQLDP
jgi:hypothetical protein